MGAIDIKKVTKTWDDFTLNIDDLEIKKGYITGFIGPNGSGKTTTIKLIMNMISKDSGSIKIFGKEYKMDDISIKEQIGYVGDISGFSHDSKICDIKKNICRFYKNWDEKLYKLYISKFGLKENKIYKDLSKGQQKKFELTMALSHHPKLIIMDEPTANLDPLVRNEFLEILQDRIDKDGVSIFYSTHITSDLDKVGDYLVFIYNGKIILSDDKDTILENHRIIKGKKELLNHETKEVFISVHENSFGFEGLVDHRYEAYEIFGEEVVYDKPNLEDILTYYTRG
ncbi:MAG: ABC transporter ATP-binding protein [Romboutsia sp.]